MAEVQSIGGAFEALRSEVLDLLSLVEGFEELARQVGGEDVSYPGWLMAIRARLDAVLVANDGLEPHVIRRTPQGRSARRMLATLPRRANGAERTQ